MARLPDLPYRDSIARSVQSAFGGYRHTEGNYDGTIFDMKNLTSDHYPLLSTREKRKTVKVAAKMNGAFAVDRDLFYVDGTLLYRNDKIVGTVEDSEKIFAVLGDRLLIFPDKVYLNFSAKGDFPSLPMLKNAVTSPRYGDVYAVGREVPYDLYYWDGGDWIFLEKECGSLEAAVTSKATFLAKGTLFGETAAQNSISLTGAELGDIFSVGDAVTIRGCRKHEENNITTIIREIDDDKLIFYEYIFFLDPLWVYEAEEELAAGQYVFTADGKARGFELISPLAAGDILRWDGTTLLWEHNGATSSVPLRQGENGTSLRFRKTVADTVEEEITISREVPDMEHICSVNNRLWGCAGDTVYGSKLGDPFNFSVFDGLSTDSYSVESGSPGEFTACCAYLGYPLFFKEHQIFKLYGSKPADYSLVASVTNGVAKGSSKSLSVVEEILFYLSPFGVMCYSGGIPTSLHDAFGMDRYSFGVGGCGGSKYYISMADGNGDRHLFVYDAVKGLWHREDDADVLCFWNKDGHLFAAMRDGSIQVLNGGEETEGTEEAEVEWYAEFGRFVQNSPDKKSVSKVLIRMEPKEDAEVQVLIAYDDGDYIPVGPVIHGTPLRSFYLPVVPSRCDHFRLRMEGTGLCRIHSLAVEYSLGSSL